MNARITEESNLRDLAQFLQEEWDALPQRRVHRLISKMRSRCCEVIEKRGYMRIIDMHCDLPYSLPIKCNF